MSKFLALLFVLCVSNASLAATIDCAALPFPPHDGALAQLNCDFHQQYEARAAQISKTFGAPGGRPVIMNLGGQLIFKHNGKSETVSITPPAYHVLKTFLHASFAIYLTLSQQNAGQMTSDSEQTLRQVQASLIAAIKTLPSQQLSIEAEKNCINLAQRTLNFASSLLNKGSWTRKKLSEFYQQIKNTEQKIIYLATKSELLALDNAVNQWMKKLSAKEINELSIVVATVHQARAHETSLQYFAKKFKKHSGEGAINENGLVVMEGKFDEESAYALLARHYLDRAASLVVFANAEALQQDVLSHAGKKIITELSP